MMFRSFFILGIFTGIISSIVSVTFAYVFNNQLFDFSITLPYWKIVACDFSLALIASGFYFGIFMFFKVYYNIIFNFLFGICSIASVMIPITAKLPNVESPEFYPTFAIPLHLFFCVIFLASSSILIKNEK